MGRIIVASPTASQRRDLRVALERDSHEVIEACTTACVIDEIRNERSDVLILDSDAVEGDVYPLCRAVRSQSDAGIIVLIRDGMEHVRIDALNAGADDYLPQRFVTAELLARVRAVMRRLRGNSPADEHVRLPDRAINLQSHKIHGPGDKVSHLTPKECLVLEHLISRMNHPVTNRELALTLWSRADGGDFEYVRTVISDLRRKIEPNPTRPQYLVTQRSVGYRFTLPASAPAARQCRTDSRAMAQSEGALVAPDSVRSSYATDSRIL
jgi:two-component system KDP operon response regulator KdpE